MTQLFAAFVSWLYGRPSSKPSAWGLGVSLVFSTVTLAGGCGFLWTTVRPIVRTTLPPPVSGQPASDGSRFGMPESQRRAVFDAFAREEPASRLAGARDFPGPELLWSAEDHRGSFERHTAAQLANQFGLTLAQVYLCLDEGIRQHWPGPDGQPLSPKTVPLHPRRW